jgi:hypothetical protein
MLHKRQYRSAEVVSVLLLKVLCQNVDLFVEVGEIFLFEGNFIIDCMDQVKTYLIQKSFFFMVELPFFFYLFDVVLDLGNNTIRCVVEFSKRKLSNGPN